MMKTSTGTSFARMLGKSSRFNCGCCTDDTKKSSRRSSRRRERQAFKKEVAR